MTDHPAKNATHVISCGLNPDILGAISLQPQAEFDCCKVYICRC